MNIANVEISRLIAHEVIRAAQLGERAPVLSDRLIRLDEKGKQLIGNRLVSTVASGSHCVDVSVEDSSVGSPFDHSSSMLDAIDKKFVETSKHLAQSLSAAQTAGSIKAGSVIFAQGTCFADNEHCRFLAIIKADSDQGLFKKIDGETITLQYVNDMILGDSQRLIKIAMFIECGQPEHSAEARANTARPPEEFSIKVFDHMMQNSGDGNAAIYFYSSFLKCRLANSASRQTKQFFEIARSYIETLELPSDEKVDLRSDLVAYLRGNRAILEPRTFARDVLPAQHQDGFITTCGDAGLTGAINKDVSLLKSKLRRQSLRFTSKVVLYAPPDVFREAVKIGNASNDGWTELKIRGSVEAMP